MHPPIGAPAPHASGGLAPRSLEKRAGADRYNTWLTYSPGGPGDGRDSVRVVNCRFTGRTKRADPGSTDHILDWFICGDRSDAALDALQAVKRAEIAAVSAEEWLRLRGNAKPKPVAVRRVSTAFAAAYDGFAADAGLAPLGPGAPLAPAGALEGSLAALLGAVNAQRAAGAALHPLSDTPEVSSEGGALRKRKHRDGTRGGTRGSTSDDPRRARARSDAPSAAGGPHTEIQMLASVAAPFAAHAAPEVTAIGGAISAVLIVEGAPTEASAAAVHGPPYLIVWANSDKFRLGGSAASLCVGARNDALVHIRKYNPKGYHNSTRDDHVVAALFVNDRVWDERHPHCIALMQDPVIAAVLEGGGTIMPAALAAARAHSEARLAARDKISLKRHVLTSLAAASTPGVAGGGGSAHRIAASDDRGAFDPANRPGHPERGGRSSVRSGHSVDCRAGLPGSGSAPADAGMGRDDP